MTCWLNGQLTENALIDATSAGALLGWGVFTTIGIREGKPLLFDRHYARLQRDADATRISFEWGEDALRQALNMVLSANRVENGLSRLTLLRRDDGRWNTLQGSDLLISAQTSAPAPKTGARLLILAHRWSVKRALAGIKTTSYLPFFLAWQEAHEQGFDEALLLTGGGSLCEGARTNIFWAKAGQLYTPSLQSGCLAGVGREWVLNWAREQNIERHEGLFQWRHLQTADEAFLISAASGPRAIASFFHPKMQTQYELDLPATMTRAVCEAWQRL